MNPPDDAAACAEPIRGVRFDGVVLCGGASSRMGRDKALVVVDGRALARRVADALAAAGATSVTAVGGDASALGALGLAVRPDEWPGEGPLGGLVTALDTVGEDIAVVLGCDLLAPDPTAIRATVWALAEAGDADASVPFVGGRAQLHHMAWRRRAAPALRARFLAGARSLHAGTAGLRVRRVEGVAIGAVRDADVPSDLEGA